MIGYEGDTKICPLPSFNRGLLKLPFEVCLSTNSLGVLHHEIFCPPILVMSITITSMECHSSYAYIHSTLLDVRFSNECTNKIRNPYLKSNPLKSSYIKYRFILSLCVDTLLLLSTIVACISSAYVKHFRHNMFVVNTAFNTAPT